MPARRTRRPTAPLAERMRPRTLDEFVGQEHLTGEGRFLRRAIEQDQVPSLILWGPPGHREDDAGAGHRRSRTGAALRLALRRARRREGHPRDGRRRPQERWKLNRQRTLLFVDEIHRFNKAQQDALLPHVEKGTVTLIGATTENPSFEVNAALLSRCRVVTLRGARGGRARRAAAPGARPTRRGWAARCTVGRRGAASSSPRSPAATRAGRSPRWRWRRPHGGAQVDKARGRGGAAAARRCSTTRAARSTTTSSPPSSSRCAARTRTRRSTG